MSLSGDRAKSRHQARISIREAKKKGQEVNRTQIMKEVNKKSKEESHKAKPKTREEAVGNIIKAYGKGFTSGVSNLHQAVLGSVVNKLQQFKPSVPQTSPQSGILDKLGEKFRQTSVGKKIVSVANQPAPQWMQNINRGLTTYSQAVENAPRFNFAENIKNKVLSSLAGIPESILNTPSDIVRGTGGYGQDLSPFTTEGRSNYLSKMGQGINVGLNIGGLMGGGSTAANLVKEGARDIGKQTLIDIVKEGAISGIKQGAGYGAAYGVSSALQGQETASEKLKNIPLSAIENAVIGGVLGGALGATIPVLSHEIKNQLIDIKRMIKPEYQDVVYQNIRTQNPLNPHEKLAKPLILDEWKVKEKVPPKSQLFKSIQRPGLTTKEVGGGKPTFGKPLQEGGIEKANRQISYVVEGRKAKEALASNRTPGMQGQQESQILKTKEGRVSSQIPRESQKQPINTQQGLQGKVTGVNKKINTSYTEPIPPKPETVKKVFENAVVEKHKLGKSITQATKDIFDPVSGVKEGTQIKTAFREHTATYRYQSDRAAQNSSTRSAVWDKVSSKDHLDFIHSVETGKPTPGTEALYKDYRARFESDYKIMQSINPDAPYRKDYFTHNGLWADPKQATEFYNKWAKETLGGSKGFMKARTFPTVFDGLNAGLKLRETNPEKLFLNNHINVLKAKMADDFTKEMAASGMPEGAVQAVVDRYMDKGIKGNAIYKTLREANAAMNSFQLGLSAFHFSTTTMNSAVSKLGLGMKEITQGRIFKGLGHIAETPVAVFTDMIKGSKVMKQAFGDNPELYAGVKQVLEAGGTFRQSRVYRIGAWDKMMENFRIGGASGIIKGVAQAPFAGVQKLAAPLMEWYVPRLKLGSFLSNASSELKRIGPNASKSEVRSVLASAWDSTDNRFGQLVQDNLLWKQGVKDWLNISTRSLGWNLGTIRELGGGVTDVFKPSMWKGLLKGKGITDRQSYTIALPVVTAAIATMYMKMHGDKPSELLDYFYPKTGDKTKQGYPERVSIPGYMKDVFAYKSNPGQTILNKQSPLFTVANKLIELSTTGGIKDYYGNWAVDPYASTSERGKQFAKFVADQFTPFSFSGARQRMDKSLQAKIESGMGFQPAPAHITKGEDVTQLSQLWRDISPAPPKTPADVAAFDAKMQTLGAKEAPNPEKVKAQIGFLTQLRATTDGSPERTQLIKDYYKTLSQDEIKSVNYKLMLAGVSTKGVSTSKDIIDIQDRYDQVKKLDLEGNFNESDKIINSMSDEDYAKFEKADKSWKQSNSTELGNLLEAKDTEGMFHKLMNVDAEEQDRMVESMDAKINKDESITDEQVNAFDEAVKKMDATMSDPKKLEEYLNNQEKSVESMQEKPGFFENIKNKVNQYKDKFLSKYEQKANDFYGSINKELYASDSEYKAEVDKQMAMISEAESKAGETSKNLIALTSSPQINLGSSLAQKNNNPGNLRFAGQEGASEGAGGFARFETPEAGYKALQRQIELDKVRGMTV